MDERGTKKTDIGIENGNKDAPDKVPDDARTSPARKGKHLQIPAWAMVLIILVILVPSMLLASIFYIDAYYGEPKEDEYTETVSTNAFLDVGGHAAYPLGKGFDREHTEKEMVLDINIATVGDEAIDVYIMSESDYVDTYYPYLNRTSGSFNPYYSFEAISCMQDTIKLHENFADSYVLVLDNIDQELSGTDTVPTQLLEVEIELTLTIKYSHY